MNLAAFVRNSWTNMNLRADNGRYVHLRNQKSKGYVGMELRITREEYVAWCAAQRELIESLRRPSIDRLDKGGHYELRNMQIVELAHNIRKDKTVFKDGVGKCYACQEVKSEEMFAVDKRRANGRSTMCKACDSERNSK